MIGVRVKIGQMFAYRAAIVIQMAAWELTAKNYAARRRYYNLLGL